MCDTVSFPTLLFLYYPICLLSSLPPLNPPLPSHSYPHYYPLLLSFTTTILSGEFSHNMRQGRGVWFNSTNGWTEYGSFLHDMEDGEMVVKSPIPQSILKVSPRSGGDNLAYEIRIGIWERGKFVRWKNNLSNPTATRAFVSLFAPPVAKVDDPSTVHTL